MTTPLPTTAPSVHDSTANLLSIHAWRAMRVAPNTPANTRSLRADGQTVDSARMNVGSSRNANSANTAACSLAKV